MVKCLSFSLSYGKTIVYVANDPDSIFDSSAKRIQIFAKLIYGDTQCGLSLFSFACC